MSLGAARARGDLVVIKAKQMYSKHLGVFVCLDRQSNISIQRYRGCLHQLEIRIFKKALIERKKQIKP